MLCADHVGQFRHDVTHQDKDKDAAPTKLEFWLILTVEANCTVRVTLFTPAKPDGKDRKGARSPSLCASRDIISGRHVAAHPAPTNNQINSFFPPV